jgi:hypothetical protein
MGATYLEITGMRYLGQYEVAHAAEDTNVAGSHKYAIVALQVYAGKAVSSTYRLNYQIGSGSWTEVGASSAVKYTDQTSLVNGATVSSANGVISGTDSDGVEVANTLSLSFTNVARGYHEIWWAVDISGVNANNTSRIQFRLHDWGQGQYIYPTTSPYLQRAAMPINLEWYIAEDDRTSIGAMPQDIQFNFEYIIGVRMDFGPNEYGAVDVWKPYLNYQLNSTSGSWSGIARSGTAAVVLACDDGQTYDTNLSHGNAVSSTERLNSAHASYTWFDGKEQEDGGTTFNNHSSIGTHGSSTYTEHQFGIHLQEGDNEGSPVAVPDDYLYFRLILVHTVTGDVWNITDHGSIILKAESSSSSSSSSRSSSSRSSSSSSKSSTPQSHFLLSLGEDMLLESMNISCLRICTKGELKMYGPIRMTKAIYISANTEQERSQK